ncbi:MAG: hypothetical protein LJE94_19400, partial [Deltaproteobacteria bacterium]|nr:hypothetical protein [Deltaproteobacteria bacterium]
MAGKDEISSTEKLLDLIREDSGGRQSPTDMPTSDEKKSAATPHASGAPDMPASDAPESEDAMEESRPAPLFSNVIPMRKRTTVGVDIGYTEIKMAMINTVSERRHELLDFTTIPFPEGIA